MTNAASYRKLAAELRAKAVNEPSAIRAAEWDNLARCYLRLVEQADTNSRQDVAAEFSADAPDRGTSRA